MGSDLRPGGAFRDVAPSAVGAPAPHRGRRRQGGCCYSLYKPG
uniref:Uncharacterized protein n=1 Tax=Triticum urartu TaxID=4572 RepID=A0A8R7NZ93_TRIUA